MKTFAARTLFPASAPLLALGVAALAGVARAQC